MTRALWLYLATVAVGAVLALWVAVHPATYPGVAAGFARLLWIEAVGALLAVPIYRALAWHDRRTHCDGIYRDCDGNYVHGVRDTDATAPKVSNNPRGWA